MSDSVPSPIHDHYEGAFDEDLRLRRGLGRLELARVQEIVRRHLPPTARVLDVGGATGVHAEWLLADGRTVHLVDDPRWFTTAYFHRPEELAEEAAEAGLVVLETVGVEGLAHWLKHLAPVFEDDGDPGDRGVVLASARTIESEPSLLGLSSHLVTVAARPA